MRRQAGVFHQAVEVTLGLRSYAGLILGLVLVTAILVATWWVDRMRITIFSGLAWLAFVSLAYWIWERRQRPSAVGVSSEPGLARAGTDSAP